MLEWSDVDLAVRDAVREFVDKEVRPHVDALESGEMEPYPIIRKLFTTFGIDVMARESLEKRLARMRDGHSGKALSSAPRVSILPARPYSPKDKALTSYCTSFRRLNGD